jgi:ABC-type nitrate/sulfonate/bicarbonate transport system substrate-binding protein
MNRIKLALLRGVCQIPAYVAKQQGFFAELEVDAQIDIQPTAWVVPQRLATGELDFAVIPWTRVAAASTLGEDLVLVCGSGCEEAAIVVRTGLAIDQVRCVAVPQEGGMKDLTAKGLMQSLGWESLPTLRLPSGDAAILSFIGQGADAASMVEPYATMLEHHGLGRVVRRTGDLWPGVPGCSLATSRRMIEEHPDLTRRVVAAYVRAARFVEQNLDRSASLAADYIGVSSAIIRRALDRNRPNAEALYATSAMQQVLDLMIELRYLPQRPRDYADLRFLDEELSLVSAANIDFAGAG